MHKNNTFRSSISTVSTFKSVSISRIGQLLIGQLSVGLLVLLNSSLIHAAIIDDSSERRIQVRYATDNSQANITPNDTRPNTPAANNGLATVNNRLATDSMQGLIEQKNRQYNFDAQLTIDESQSVVTYRPTTPRYRTRYNTTDNSFDDGDNFDTDTIPDFNNWLRSNQFRGQEVASLQQYLASQIGAQNVPPLEQLLKTARSWNKCGYEPYQIPPRELWSNMVPTLRLYSALKNQRILPQSSEIRSVYRSPGLNACAGGARNSSHMTASAMDIWVPSYENDFWQLSRMQDSLCDFWQYQGQAYDFGLGLYSTGAIHLDTQKYRKWGFNNTSSSSSCRY